MWKTLNTYGSNIAGVIVLAAMISLVGRMTDDKRPAEIDHLVVNVVLRLASDLIFPAEVPKKVALTRNYDWKIEMPVLDTTPLKEAKLPIVWVLGGPGSGKGTLCTRIVKEFGYTHISTGDLLRADVESGSERGKLLKGIMDKGELVPTNVVMSLLTQEMLCRVKTSNGFLIDGYPRELDQGRLFEEMIQPCSVVLYLEAADELMTSRLLGRGQGRADDNPETIKKRLETFHKNNDPILEHYHCKTKRVCAAKTPEEVYEDAKAILCALVKE